MIRLLSVAALLAVGAGCSCHAPAAAPSCASCPPAGPGSDRPNVEAAGRREGPLPVCEAKGQLPLEAARAWFDAGDYGRALSCAAQAAALSPSDVQAHCERAAALAGLERLDEARVAWARALALDPESLEALAGAAHLYAVQLPSSREHDDLGALYAERGFELAGTRHDEVYALIFARLSAMAFNDVGAAADALERADWVLARQPDDAEAGSERAVALFELCRFQEAHQAFERLLDDPERAAFAHQHLGLLDERAGRPADAEAHLRRAAALDPRAFPPPVLLDPADFRAELERTLASLPGDMRRDLAEVPVQVEDLPSLEDLTATEPPLSPAILGLFRGPPLDEPCLPEPDASPGAPCRSVVVYRKNLSRAVTSRAELVDQLRVTVLHEVGHLRGEDDGELAARGLE